MRYDFNDPVGTLPAEMLHTFDVVVIDPPFITEEVWQAYARAACMLLKRKPSSEAGVAGDQASEPTIRDVQVRAVHLTG